MGFYGNITNINKSSFSFDKIYANRKEMDANAAIDGVYVGRYVLVDYDKKSILATQASEVADSFNVSNDPLRYANIVEGFEKYYNYNLDLLEQKTNSNLRPAWMIIQTDGSYEFHTGPSYATPVYEFSEDSGEGLHAGDLVLLLGKRKCISEIPDNLKFTDAYELENYQSNELASIITQDGAVYSYFIPEIWYCTGGRPIEWSSNGIDYIKTVATFEKSSITYSEQIDMNNATLFNSNYSEDAVAYGKIGRGWDSTVWQKTTGVNAKGQVVNKYVMIAELNSVVPTLDISVDAPTQTPIAPHFGTDISNVYYKMHIQPTWGMRVKSSYSDYTTDKKRYPSDISGAFLIDTLLSDGTVARIGRRIKTLPDGTTQIVDYPPVLDEFGNVVPEDIEDMPLAIYFNKDGFDPYQASDALTSVEHDYGSEALKSIARNVGTSTRPKWEVRDTIAIKPTGTSNQEYNVHTAEGDLFKKNLPDTYEMSIMLPSIGNMANTFWNMLYGPNAKEDIKGRSLWHVNTGAFVKNDDTSTYVRNTEFRWNTRNGRRGVTNALFDSSFYIGNARNPIAKTYDEIMELKDTSPATSLLVKNSFNDNYINIGTVGDFDPIHTHLLQDRLLYNMEDLNTVAGSINTLHDLTGMIVRYTSLEDENASVKIPDDYIADFTNSSQRNLLWEYRAERLSDWDPTKIYYDVSDQRYYYKDKTYTYDHSTTSGYERSGSHWYKPISGDKFIDLNTAKYYRAERMEYPRYSETNLTKDVMNLPYFDYILAKTEDDYVEGAVYYQVYDEDYFLSNPNVQAEKTRLENKVASETDPVLIEEAQEELAQFLKGEYKNSNDEVVLRFPTPLILYNVGYEPGIYSYEDTNSSGQRIYTLDSAPLPTRPDARYIKITNSKQQQGFVLYTSGGFYRWDNRDETLILCRNASLKGALDLPEDFVPEHPDTELITSSYEWNEKINLYDDDKNVIGEDNRFIFFPRNQAFEEYLHIADSEEGKTIYVAGDEIPDVIPINFPTNLTRWQIELEDDNKLYLYIYAGLNDEDHPADKLVEQGHDKIPVENILFKRETYLQELNTRLAAYVENPGTITRANLDAYLELLNNNNENKYFDQYQAYLYLCVTTPEEKDEDGNIVTQEVSDYLPFWTIITEGYAFKLENGKKVPKMVISTIGKESSSSSIHFDVQEAKEKGLNVQLKEFEANKYYYHPNNDGNKWAAEIRANLLTESGLWRNTLNGGYNGYYTIEYETLPPESQADDFEEVNDNNHFRFFTLDREQAYRYQDIEGNWREEILSRTYPRDTRDINYYDIKFLRVPSDKIVYQSGIYYEKNGNGEFVLTEDTTPNASKTYYQIEQRYVESDTSGIYKTGSIWNEEVVPVPDTVTIGFREESWRAKPIEHYANNENTFNGLILRQNNMMRDGDELTRDRSTVQGTINTLNDIIAKFYTLTPCEFVTVDEYGRVHSASWDSIQPDTITNLGLPSDVRTVANTDKRWINLTLDDDKDNPHFTIKHQYNPVEPVNTYANKNENTTVTGNVGLNHSADDTLKLYTPLIDATGHVVGKNTETVTLPFNYKVVTIGAQSEIVYDSTKNNLTAGSTIDKSYSGTGSLVAENTKDTFTVNTGNKWIRLIPNLTTKSYQISHEVHNINVSDNTSTNLNAGSGTNVINIPDWDFDNAGHIIEKHNHEYTLPYGYKFVQDEGNDSIQAGNTQDKLIVVGDSYLTTSVSDHTLTISHDKVSPTTATTQLVSDVETPTFGSTFTIADYSFDNQGHRIVTSSHTVQFPEGQLANGTHVATSANVVTSLAFNSTSGTITKTDANVGTLPLTGYEQVESISAMPIATDSINVALAKVTYILNNSTTTVDSRISTAINALDAAESSDDFVAKIKETNGVISATTGTFGTSGTIATNAGSNREVVTSVTINHSGVISGTKLTLGTAALSATTDFDAAGAANTVKTDLIGTATDTQASDTIIGAKKYTDNAVTTMESKQYGASGSAQYTFAEMVAKLNDLEARLAALES